jgi:hypothetical protein
MVSKPAQGWLFPGRDVPLWYVIQVNKTAGRSQQKLLVISKFRRVVNVAFFFFWVIPRRLNFMCRRFGTFRLFHLHRSCEQEYTLAISSQLFFSFTRPMRMEQRVPKRRHIKLKTAESRPKKEYNKSHSIIHCWLKRMLALSLSIFLLTFP